MARWRFSESIPLKFEHKLRRHLQWFGKITKAAVLDEDENLLWSRLQWHWSCHSNEMTPFPILLTAVFLGSGNGSSHIVHGSLFPPIATSMFEKFNPTIVRRAVSYALTMCSIKWLFSRSMFISFDLVKQRRGILQCLSTQQRLLSVFTTRN